MSEKNKLDATTFCKLLDEFGEEAAKQTQDADEIREDVVQIL